MMPFPRCGERYDTNWNEKGFSFQLQKALYLF